MPTSSEINFCDPWKHSDITFDIEDQTIYASKLILSMWSPVFDAMFNDNFKEKDATIIKLPGKEKKNMLLLMKVLHPPNEEIHGKIIMKTQMHTYMYMYCILL